MKAKAFIWSLLFYMLSALGISLTIKASVGVSSFNSLNVVLSELSLIKVGTITTVINLLFLLACWLMERKSKRNIQKYLLMFLALICFGNVINLILYYVLGHFVVTSYLLRIGMFIIGTIIAGIGTGQVLRLNYLKFPIENFCILISERTKRSFKFYRYGVDVICVSLSLVISLGFGLPIVVREGTLISLFLLSGVISWSTHLYQTNLNRAID